MKIFNIDGYNVALMKSYYTYNDSMAIMLDIVEGDDVVERYDTITVCLGWPAPDEGCAFVDSNSFIDYGRFLEDNKLAEPTGNNSISGFCTYAEYEFCDEIINLADCEYL